MATTSPVTAVSAGTAAPPVPSQTRIQPAVRDGGWQRVRIGGVDFDACTERDLVAFVMDALVAGAGGTIVTPNVDILRVVRRDDDARALVNAAQLVVADGMPLLWAAKVAGTPLPARVPGSDLIWSLSAAAATTGRTVYLLGGDTGVPEKAADVLCARYPGLRVAGTSSPPYGFDRSPEGVEAVVEDLVAAKPDIVFVGMGFPRQERLIATLTGALPATWFLGCGASIPFVAGTLRRAPEWMQRAGVEWLHRLVSEPRRLFSRYVRHDAPYAARLMGGAVRTRMRRQPRA